MSDLTITSPYQGKANKSIQLLTFTIGNEEYGIDILSVREIKGWSESTRLPNAPDYIRGVMNLRGLIIPTFDLRCRFNQGITKATDKNVVIIVAIEERNIGILVDTVSDIITVTEADIKPAPEAISKVESQFLGGLISVDERMVILLLIDHLFDRQTIQITENQNLQIQ